MGTTVTVRPTAVQVFSVSSTFGLSTDELVVDKFLNTFNAHDIQSLRNLCTTNCTFNFVQSEMEMKLDDYMEETLRLSKSFPNLRVRFRRINEINSSSSLNDKV